MRQLEAHGARAIVDLMFAPQPAAAIAAELPALRQQLPANTRLTFGVLYHSGRETGAHLFPSRAALEAALDRVAFEAGERIPAAGPTPLAFRREGCPCAMGQHVHVRSDGDTPPCGPWRVRVLSELLADDHAEAAEWSVAFLLAEARQRGLDAPADLVPRFPSRHILET